MYITIVLKNKKHKLIYNKNKVNYKCKSLIKISWILLRIGNQFINRYFYANNFLHIIKKSVDANQPIFFCYKHKKINWKKSKKYLLLTKLWIIFVYSKTNKTNRSLTYWKHLIQSGEVVVLRGRFAGYGSNTEDNQTAIVATLLVS